MADTPLSRDEELVLRKLVIALARGDAVAAEDDPARLTAAQLAADLGGEDENAVGMTESFRAPAGTAPSNSGSASSAPAEAAAEMWPWAETAFLDMPDVVGCNATLALLVANSDVAIALFVAICQADPKALIIAHTPGPFEGENALHVLCANRREEALLELIPVACERLTRRDLKRLLNAQASGGFFAAPPMLFYGGTPLAYAVAFSLFRPILMLFEMSLEHPEKMAGLCDVNDIRHACKNTGFL